MAVWSGFVVPGLDTHVVGSAGNQSRLALFSFMNWPWSSMVATAAVLIWGHQFPPLDRTYVVAGVAGSAAVARVAPALAEATSEVGAGLKRSVSQAAHASRRAMGWALVSFLTIPWISPHQIRLDWLVLAVPASFAGRALWEPWWWHLSWNLAGWMTRSGWQ